MAEGSGFGGVTGRVRWRDGVTESRRAQTVAVVFEGNAI